MDAQKAIQGGYAGSGEVLVQSAVHFLRDGAEYAPCDLKQETLSLARDIEDRHWGKADATISYILIAVRGIFLNQQGMEWATWIGMAQKVIERQGATSQ
jgi:hypothetical protein